MNLNLNTQKTKKLFTISLLASAISGGISTAALAEDTEVITVTGSRAPISVDKVLASQVTIEREDIERIQPKSVLDLLSSVAGLDQAQTGGRGQSASVYVRGGNANHTLILVDGVRVSSATLGSTNVNTIAPESIERIEIVKGPRAALWGSEAIGGVIQIFTRKLSSGDGFVGVTAGSESYIQGKAGLGFSHGNGSTSVTVNHEKSDGFDVISTDAKDDDDGYSYTSVAIRGEQQLNDKIALDWMFANDQGDNDYDPQFGSGSDESEFNNHVWRLRGGYQGEIAGKKNLTTLSIGQNRDWNVNFGDGVSKANGSKFETRRDQFSLVNHTSISDNFDLSVGADLNKEEIAASSTYAEQKRDLTAYFAHGVYQLENISVEAAIRYDDVENIDSETTYNFGTAYQFSADTRLVASLGTGFKAPTFNDLYHPWGGNPDLVSETSDTAELTLDTHISDVQLSVSVYKTDIEDLINWAPIDPTDPNSAWQPSNIDEVEIFGSELVASYVGFGGKHDANFSYTDAEDKKTKEQLRRRAKEQFNYTFSTQVADVDLYLEYQYNGERNDGISWDGSLIDLKSYSLVNFAASYDVTEQLKANLRVSNLLDKDYEVVKNYNSQGSSVYLGVTYSL